MSRADGAAIAALIQKQQVIAPGRRDDMPPANGSSTRGRSTSARTSLVTGQLQAASVPTADSLGSCATQQRL